jgi:hypothetical protein
MSASISNCSCKHEDQDNLHGKQERVMNHTSTKVPEGSVEIRCTVCGKEKVIKR